VSDVDGCRSFAAVGDVRIGDTPGALSCRFDAATSEHRCDIATEQARLSSVTEYASLADFVEAGHSVGKQTSLSETRTEGSAVRHVRHHYDELGRVVRSVEDAHGTTLVTRYSDYDAAGRPRHARTEPLGGDDSRCEQRLLSFEYADATRTVLTRSRSEDPERCGFEERTVIERYDAVGNRISVDAADGGGVASLYRAPSAARTERVCL
jgi:RHS repeat protein